MVVVSNETNYKSKNNNVIEFCKQSEGREIQYFIEETLIKSTVKTDSGI